MRGETQLFPVHGVRLEMEAHITSLRCGYVCCKHPCAVYDGQSLILSVRHADCTTARKWVDNLPAVYKESLQIDIIRNNRMKLEKEEIKLGNEQIKLGNEKWVERGKTTLRLIKLRNEQPTLQGNTTQSKRSRPEPGHDDSSRRPLRGYGPRKSDLPLHPPGHALAKYKWPPGAGELTNAEQIARCSAIKADRRVLCDTLKVNIDALSFSVFEVICEQLGVIVPVPEGQVRAGKLCYLKALEASILNVRPE